MCVSVRCVCVEYQKREEKKKKTDVDVTKSITWRKEKENTLLLQE